MATTLLPKELDTKKITFSDVFQSKDGKMSSVRMNYIHDSENEPEKLIIQSAKMKAPFGLSNGEKFGTPNKWDIQLSFQGEERSKRIQRFRHCIEYIDECILDKAFSCSEDWMDDEYSSEMLKMFYKSPIKKSKKKDKKYADTFKVTVPWNADAGEVRNDVLFYDEKGEEMSWKEVTPGCEVVALFEINGLWCSPGIKQFGPSVKLQQLQVFKPKRIRGFQIKCDLSDDEDDEDDEDNTSIAIEEEVVSDPED